MGVCGMRDAVVTNAAIDWYVMNNTVEGGDDMLEYQGAGFVTVDTSDTTAKVTIRTADLRPTQARGSLTDPIGPARVTGTFVAQQDNERLQDLLAAIRARSAQVASSR